MEEETAWQLLYTKQAKKDAKKLASSNSKDKAEELLAILAENPFQNPPPYEKFSWRFRRGLFSENKCPTSISLRDY